MNASVLSYVISSIVWAVAGLVVGFYLGRAGRLAQTNPEVPVEPDPLPPTRRRRLTFEQILGAAVVLLAVVSVVVMAVTLTRQQDAINEQRGAVACQAEFNARFASALRERTEAAASERRAMRNLLDVILNPAASREERAGALTAYRDGLAAADSQRAASPLPLQPSCEPREPK